MATAITMPKLGLTMEEGTICSWPHPVDCWIEKGALVLVIESEKNESEIEAPVNGFLRHLYVEEGDTVPCGTLLGAITRTADEPFDVDAFHLAEDRPETKGSGVLEVKTPKGTATRPNPQLARIEKRIAPAARAAAKKLGIDPSKAPGTGPNGRVTRRDVETYAAEREALIRVAEGVHLEVPTTGAGDPVVLLPGLGTDVSAFTRQIPALAEHFRVVGVNPRGVGLSDAPEMESYAIPELAADIAATYQGAADLVGASLGAAIALELALTQPERVRSLTLITPFVQATPRLLAVGEGWRRVATEATPEALASALLPWFFSSGFLADEGRRDRILRGLAQTVARVPAKTLDRMIAGMSAWSGTRVGDLSGISIPTLVILAGEDLLAPDGKRVASSIPNAEILVVEGAGHAVALEAPEPVNEAIAKHLHGRP
ncbi:MAG: alpha/beta fold hydrolase [bacterium]|nr:alpha/beta fold hydrolase [bacterium]